MGSLTCRVRESKFSLLLRTSVSEISCWMGLFLPWLVALPMQNGVLCFRFSLKMSRQGRHRRMMPSGDWASRPVKSLFAAVWRLAKSRRARRRHLTEAGHLKPARRHLIGEIAANLAMTRRYRRARRGQRTRDNVPQGRRQQVTMIEDLTLQGVGSELIFEGATNSGCFEIYIREGFLPILKFHEVVVMGNLSDHHWPIIARLISSRKRVVSSFRPTSQKSDPLSCAG